MNHVDLNNIQITEWLRKGVSFRPSKIKRPDGGLGLFMKIPVVAGQIVGYYYGNKVSTDIYYINSTTKTHIEGFMGVNREFINKWGLELKRKFFDRNGKNIRDGFIPHHGVQWDT